MLERPNNFCLHNFYILINIHSLLSLYIMFKNFLLIFSLILLSGCVAQIPKSDVQKINTPADTTGSTTDSNEDIQTINELLKNKEELLTVVHGPLGELPNFINSKQVFATKENTGTIYTLGNFAFLLVYQPNMNYDVGLQKEESINIWSGILMKEKEQQEWKKILSISDRYDSETNKNHRYNPIGIFTNDSIICRYCR